MVIRLKKSLFFLILLMVLASINFVYGQKNGVVTLGNDLNQQQRDQMINLFRVSDDVKILVITNAEERRSLEGLASEEQIGTRAISSAYVEELPRGEGIEIQTYNITWVTTEMFQNALVTAGVEDARVIAAAPFDVSGTAALTGMIKAFEELRGEGISEEQKQVANEEMIKTGQLGDAIGKEKAAQLIREIKEEIVEKRIKDPEEIKRIIIEISGRLDINLKTQQIDDLTKLMEGISRLNLDTNQIRQQLRGIGEQIGEITRQNEEARSFLERIIDMLRRLLESILGMLTKR